ncbi:MAG: diguanylate cyclase [Microcoleaceae cyanobacterium]
MNKKESQNLSGNILIVDDAPENLRLLSSMLQHHGYNVRKAINGRIAINGAQIAKPDLILLDINLPDIDGYEVCQKLKSFEQTKDIPIIFISAYSEEVDKLKAFEVGGRDYITKPFQLREVLARVENQLSIYQLQLQLKERNKKLEQEILERQRAEEEVRFLLSTTEAITAAPDIHAALEITLSQVCLMIAWDFGEAWIPSTDNSKLEYAQGWYTREENLLEFGKYSETLTFASNIGLLGRVWQSQHSEWIEDIAWTLPEVFPRYDIALKVGFKSCFAVPILWKDRVLAVLVFFKKERMNKNQQLIDLVKAAASHLAVIIQSIKAEYTLQLANQKFRLLATLDGLTKVANRRRFDEYLDQEWRRMKRDKLPLSLIICDLDYFQLYNDIYGHKVGDDCLKQIAKTISKVVHRPGDLVARYGGEEFAILLSNTDAEGALTVAENIRSEVQNLNIPNSKSPINEFLTISLGVSSTIPQSEKSPQELVSLADQALARAKNQQGNCIVKC